MHLYRFVTFYAIYSVVASRRRSVSNTRAATIINRRHVEIMPSPQARYFLLTIPHNEFMPFLPDDLAYIKGQLERGGETGYLHWQILAAFKKKVSCAKVKSLFGNSCHVEISRSAAANDYVWKEDTRVDNTQFELGHLAMKRNCSTDWDVVRTNAEQGNFKEIPSDVYVRHFSNLKRIHVDSLAPNPCVKEVYVFWGKTGTGKSKRAWEEATFDAYPKDPNSKFWDGYRGQENVVIDEYRGAISISHMLRWLDRYPTIVEIKGSSSVLACKRIWITSNISPDQWYPDLDEETRAALRRRFTQVIHFN